MIPFGLQERMGRSFQWSCETRAIIWQSRNGWEYYYVYSSG